MKIENQKAERFNVNAYIDCADNVKSPMPTPEMKTDSALWKVKYKKKAGLQNYNEFV